MIMNELKIEYIREVTHINKNKWIHN